MEWGLYGICVLGALWHLCASVEEFFPVLGSWRVLLLRAGLAEVLRIWSQLKNHILGGVQAPKPEIAIPPQKSNSFSWSLTPGASKILSLTRMFSQRLKEVLLPMLQNPQHGRPGQLKGYRTYKLGEDPGIPSSCAKGT